MKLYKELVQVKDTEGLAEGVIIRNTEAKEIVIETPTNITYFSSVEIDKLIESIRYIQNQTNEPCGS